MSTQVTTGVEEKIGRLIGGINNLPTPPIVFSQIQKVLSNPNTSAYEIGSILQEDPAITAKVLKLTNSAYYGLSQTIESVKQAVVIVGLEAIKNLVLSASMFQAFSSDQIDQEFQDYFWRHSLATAFGARLLARTLKSRQIFDAESGFSAGLLHDIGKMVISVYMVEQAGRIRNLKTKNPKRPDREIEEEVLGYNHTQIGALLAEHWKLPTKLIEAIQFHHFPQLRQDEDNNLPFLVNMANYLATLTFDVDLNEEEKAGIELVREETLTFVGISQEKLNAFAYHLRDEYTKSETFMEMAKGAA
jgi:putative nucleotidyltransferase with HDIG domain